jgi:nucleotide-binding universal stress UspA family protein
MNILLTTDFSYGALKAARYIINLFGVNDHQYLLLNSVNVKFAGGTFYQDFIDEVDAYHESELTTVAATLKNEFSGLAIHTSAEVGSLITAISRLQQDNQYGLIGLGANGSSNIYEKLIGSTALDVIDHCQMPLAIVPVVSQFEHPKKIMVAVGKNTNDSKKQLIDLMSAFTVSPNSIFLYHIGEFGEVDMEALRKELSEAFPTVTIQLIANPTSGAAIENQLLEFAAEREVDLLFISPKDHNFIQRLFKHSITDHLVERTHIPMIALKD